MLTSGEEDEAIASARLELPENTVRQFRNPGFAMLVLHFEPLHRDGRSPRPASSEAWAERIVRVLEVSPALVGLLSGELDLGITPRIPVQVGVRLEAQGDMAEMIDVTGLEPMRGGQHTSQAIGYFNGDGNGDVPADAARRMIRDVLRYALAVES